MLYYGATLLFAVAAESTADDSGCPVLSCSNCPAAIDRICMSKQLTELEIDTFPTADSVIAPAWALFIHCA